MLLLPLPVFQTYYCNTRFLHSPQIFCNKTNKAMLPELVDMTKLMLHPFFILQKFFFTGIVQMNSAA